MEFKEPVERYIETTDFLNKNLNRPLSYGEVSLLHWLSNTEYKNHYTLMGLFKDLSKNTKEGE